MKVDDYIEKIENEFEVNGLIVRFYYLINGNKINVTYNIDTLNNSKSYQLYQYVTSLPGYDDPLRRQYLKIVEGLSEEVNDLLDVAQDELGDLIKSNNLYLIKHSGNTPQFNISGFRTSFSNKNNYEKQLKYFNDFLFNYFNRTCKNIKHKLKKIDYLNDDVKLSNKKVGDNSIKASISSSNEKIIKKYEIREDAVIVAVYDKSFNHIRYKCFTQDHYLAVSHKTYEEALLTLLQYMQSNKLDTSINIACKKLLDIE